MNVSVAFAGTHVNGGAISHFYSGTLKSINNDSIILSDVSTKQYHGFSSSTVTINNILINKNYIIYIEEI